MKPEDSQVRRDICKDCSLNCDVRSSINHDDACQSCPQRIWHRHESCDNDDPKQMRGAGDLVAIVANPIAKILRIDPKKCGCHGPNGRQSKLNSLIPFK